MSTERTPVPATPTVSGTMFTEGLSQPEGPPPGEPPPLVSILVPCCGQIEYTRLCVPLLLRHSRRPCELIFADVGSLDGTPDYLDGVAAAAPVPVEVVHAAAEADFEQACTECLRRARGRFVVWLNNDTLVPEAWLQQLVALVTMSPDVGMVGPMSNYAPLPQRVGRVPYRLRPTGASRAGMGDGAGRVLPDLEAVDRFAREWREQHRGQWFEVERLGAFCLLLKREVLDKVGLFEEGAAPGVFDANAVSWKVRHAGYRLACCRDLFVHHFGSRVAAG